MYEFINQAAALYLDDDITPALESAKRAAVWNPRNPLPALLESFLSVTSADALKCKTIAINLAEISSDEARDELHYDKLAVQLYLNLGIEKGREYVSQILSIPSEIKCRIYHYYFYHYLIGMYYGEMEESSLSFHHYEKASSIIGEKCVILVKKAQMLIYVNGKDYVSMAESLVKDALIANPNSIRARQMEIQIQIQYDCSDNLIILKKRAEQLVQLYPNYPRNHVLLADLFARVDKDYIRAIQQCAQAIKIDKNFYRAWTMIAVYMNMIGNYSDALLNINNGLKYCNRTKEKSYPLFIRSLIHVNLDDYISALTDVNDAIKLERGNQQYYITRIDINVIIGRWSAVYDDCMYLIVRELVTSKLYVNASKACRMLGKAKESIKYAFNAIMIHGIAEDDLVRAYTEYAFTMLINGRYREAIANAEYSADKADPEAYMILSLVNYKMGNMEEGKRYHDLAMSIDYSMCFYNLARSTASA
jgi:tetratricopeptide (TPR) repeat protein